MNQIWSSSVRPEVALFIATRKVTRNTDTKRSHFVDAVFINYVILPLVKDHFTFKTILRDDAFRCDSRAEWINSLPHERCGDNFKSIISDTCYGLSSWTPLAKLLTMRMPNNSFGGKSTLFQVMVGCLTAKKNYYLSQCLPRSMSPNGVTRPQSVNNCIAMHATCYS